MKTIATLATAMVLTALPDATAQVMFSRIITGDIVTDLNHSYGCAWGDFDGDGFPDLVVANAFGERLCLYRNRGDATFEKYSHGPLATDSADACAAVWADYDNDGDLDLFVTNWATPIKDFFYRNNGDGTFERILEGSWVNDDGAGVHAAWGDYDGDGYVDLVVRNSHEVGIFQYRNQRDGTMERVLSGAIPADEPGGALVWTDYDGDGDLDLYGGAISRRDARLYRNDGTGAFEQVEGPGARAVVASGAAWADINNDGLVDLFVCDGGGVRPKRNQLFVQRSLGDFLEVVEGDIVEDVEASSSCAWGDYDNDGWLDLFVANAIAQNDSLYRSNRDGTFTKVLDDDVVLDYATSIACSWGDYDNDGFLDLFVAAGGGDSPNDPPAANLLYHNHGNANAWLLAKLIGTVSNRSAIGAKVRARSTIDGKEFWQLREISGGSGYCSQNDLRAHFGLGDATKVDTLRIEWPSGIVQELRDVPAKQILTVTEPPRLIPQGAGAFQIRCWINQSFEVQASMDLVEWSAVETVTNLTGTLVFEDAEAEQHESRYYRVATTP